jgi:hypothetical protein
MSAFGGKADIQSSATICLAISRTVSALLAVTRSAISLMVCFAGKVSAKSFCETPLTH